MPTRRIRTADYSEQARARLGAAVANAREAAGYRWRTDFAPVADVSVRSLAAVEQGEPTVGQGNLHRIARALPGWTEDTPRIILEGGPVPPSDRPAEEEIPQLNTAELRRVAVAELAEVLMRGGDYVAALRYWTSRFVLKGDDIDMHAVSTEAHERFHALLAEENPAVAEGDRPEGTL